MSKNSAPLFWLPWHRDNRAAYSCLGATRKETMTAFLRFFPAGTKWKKQYRGGWRLRRVKIVKA